MSEELRSWTEEEMADPAFLYDSKILTIVRECADAAAILTAQRSCGLIELDQYETAIAQSTCAHFHRIMDVVEKVVQSCLAGRLPRRGAEA
jgi:hypothetical protein